MTIAHLENFSGMLLDSALQNYSSQQSLSLPGTTIDNYNYWNSYPVSGYPAGLRVTKSGDKFWFGGYTTLGVATPHGMSLALASLVKPTTNNFTIGYRMRRQLPGNLTSGSSFYVPGLSQGIALSASVFDNYIELVFNRTGRTIDTYIDGKFVVTANLANGAAVAAAALGANTLAVGIPLGTNAGMFITDLYVNEDLGDGSPGGRLGPQDITDLPLQVVEAKDFTTADLADVMARKDLSASSKALVGSGDGASLKLKLKDGYVLPLKGRVSGLYLQSRGNYTAGAPGDIAFKVTRGTHSDQQTPVLEPDLSWSAPGARLGNSSRSDDEILSATALNGLEVALTVVAR